MRILGAFALSVSAAFAAVSDVHVLGVTNTQGVIIYRAPSSADCTVEVSEESDYTPLVHDVDATLFSGSDLDSRSASANRGIERTFVVGKRTIERASNGRNYSRALQAATQYFFRINCDGDIATGTFTTRTIPLGLTRVDAYQVSQDYPGRFEYISADKTQRNETWNDPHTGAQVRLMNNENDWLENRNNLAVSVIGTPANWTDPSYLGSGGAGQYAVYDGADCSDASTCDKILIESADIGAWVVQPSSTSYFKIDIPGLGSDGTEEGRKIIVCLAPHPSQYGSPAIDCDADATALTYEATLPETEGTVSIQGSFRQREYSTDLEWFQTASTADNPNIRMLIRKKNNQGTISIRSAKISWRGSINGNTGSAGGHERCAWLARSDKRLFCTSYQGGIENIFYLVHQDTGEVTFIGRAYTYIPEMSGYMIGLADHQMFSTTDPNVWYFLQGNRFIEFTYIGDGLEKASNYTFAVGTDISYRIITSDVKPSLQAFYDAHTSEYESLLGGSGNYLPFDTTSHGACAIYTVQDGIIVGGCLSGSADTSAWRFALDPSDGHVLGLHPMYAAAGSRWCSHHTNDVYNGAIAINTCQKMQYRMQQVGAVDNTGTQITLTITSSCATGECTGFHEGDPVYYGTDGGATFVMPVQPGDLLGWGNVYGTSGIELATVVSRSGNQITINRGANGSTKQSHADGTYLYPACYPWTGAAHTAGGMLAWDPINDPYGQDLTGTYTYGFPYIGHTSFRNCHRSDNNYYWSQGCGDWSAAGATFIRWEPLGFGGQVGTGIGLNYQTHPAIDLGGQTILDVHPFNGGTGISKTVSLVSGYTYVYKVVKGDFTTTPQSRQKYYDWMGTSREKVLRNISGPGSVISDETPYTLCIAMIADECVTGSAAGDIYANTLLSLNNLGCFAGESFGFSSPRDLCAGPVEWLNSSISQTLHDGNPLYQRNYLGMVDWAGINITNYLPKATGAGNARKLAGSGTSSMYREIGGFGNAHATPNGRFLLTDWSHFTEGRRVAVVKIPPISRDSIDRTRFYPIKITIPAGAIPAGTDNVVADFGYAEYGTPDQFRCSQRAEGCVAHNNVVNEANPFSYVTTEDATISGGLGCASGCTLVIPALPAHVLYYRVRYRDENNAAIISSPVQVAVAP